MEHPSDISQFTGFCVAWLLVVCWFSYRAWRRGDGLVWVVVKLVLSFAVAAALVVFIRQKLNSLAGEFSSDAPFVLWIVGMIVIGDILLSALWTKEIADLVAAPLANVFDGGSEPPEPDSNASTAKINSGVPVFATKDTNPSRLAAAYVRHLKLYPHDSAIREKLAVLYARHFKRLDLATRGFEMLINGPLHSEKEAVRWLKLLAKMQIELHASVEAVEKTFDRILELFPHDLEAITARQRLEQARHS
jgi:hypothetical protein